MAHHVTALDMMAMNKAIMERMGGESALRDGGALESAVVRPQMAARYAEASLAEQAATLLVGIALAHAFVDGNKPTALAAGITFLILNGQYVVSKPEELGRQLLAVIARQGSLDDAIAELAAWIDSRLAPI